MDPFRNNKLQAKQILETFFHRTIPAKKRYLWTDSFAIVGFVKLGQRKHAVELADQVINVLGKFKNSDEWLSGDPNRPTLKGLRIGKPLDERKENEPFDEDFEWERDGQYYHYATKFAWALQTLAESDSSESEKYLLLATDLMTGVNKGFIYFDESTPTMYWKMDTKLSRPLVPSQGQHDPLDGYITCASLGFPSLELQNLKDIALRSELATVDLLGIGGLLMDCARSKDWDPHIFEKVKAVTEASIRLFLQYQARRQMGMPATRRLCFREMGFSIGAAMARAKGISFSTDFRSLEREINEFWKVDANRNNTVYSDHQDINDVMRACALIFNVPPKAE